MTNQSHVAAPTAHTGAASPAQRACSHQVTPMVEQAHFKTRKAVLSKAEKY